jgi:hypothetical protein
VEGWVWLTRSGRTHMLVWLLVHETEVLTVT